MEENLLKEVSKRIVEDKKFGYFLERYHSLSKSQELVISYYLDKKVELDKLDWLMTYELDKQTLDKIVELINTGENVLEAEAIIWLSNNGFENVYKIEDLSYYEKAFVNLRLKDRLIHIKEINDELGYDSKKFFEFLELTKNCHELKVWQENSNWPCERIGYNDKVTAVIVIAYRLFCQHGGGYLQAIFDLQKAVKPMSLSFGTYLDYFVYFADLKIAPQTIFELILAIRKFYISDSISNQHAFGDKADEVIQYWIKHSYENETDFFSFFWINTISKEAESYTIEAKNKGEIVWAKLMKVFNIVFRHNSDYDKNLISLLFKWLFSTVPKTRIENVLGLINRLMLKGYQYMEAFIMKAELFPKKELLLILRQKDIKEILRSMYIDELGENLFNIIFDMEKEKILPIMTRYEIISFTRNIISVSQNKDIMHKFILSNLSKLDYSQYYLMNWLAENNLPLNLTIVRYIFKMDYFTLQRLEYGLNVIKKSLWADLIRLEAKSSKILQSCLTKQEIELLLDNNVSESVIVAVGYFVQMNRKIYDDQDDNNIIYSSNDDDYSTNPYFIKLVKMGANCLQLYNLCINRKYINDEFVRFWINYQNDGTPKQELINRTGWLDSYYKLSLSWEYCRENCNNLMKVINEHEQAIPVALKALEMFKNFDQTIKLVLDETLTDTKINELLLEKTDITVSET